MPYREKPPQEPFDPGRHVHSTDKKSYVRKSAIESDEDAVEEANWRNQEEEEKMEKKNWFRKLFYKKQVVRGVDILHEEALAEHVKDLKLKQFYYTYIIEGKFNNIPIKITGPKPVYGIENMVDNQKISQKEARFLLKKFFPMLIQARKNSEAAEARNAMRKKKLLDYD